MSAELLTADVAGAPATRAAAPKSRWLFSPRADVCVFGGSALVSLALLVLGARAGVLNSEAPNWTWVPAVLLVDVAHVYATGFRVYFDVEEVKRRAGLYVLAPAIALALGVALYSESDALFWRALAYLAVFHFVRQQYGWVAMYRVRGWVGRGEGNPRQAIVVATTVLCWYVGIVAFNSDYAFTVTNVVIHGVPYIALVWWYARMRAPRAGKVYRQFARWPVFLATLWLLAYAEELLWDRGVWHERAWLFGAAWDWSSLKVFLVPLLALPQATHYVLDGFVWRRRSNPQLSSLTTAPSG